ncbi:MAG TPA: 2-oxoglutarate dehydrogenase E1 component [Verrucomicrobiae bacterium]|nr:2-oxoglutarate dehydrogenase E1 component [Verrucomicrobiae bacterium]
MSETRQIQEAAGQKSADAAGVIEGYRRWGYSAANLDPLGPLIPVMHPELVVTGDAAERARKFYCGTIGAEFFHIDDTERRRWIAERLECDPPKPDRGFILERLIRAELFEQVLQARYLGSKRFSLEGVTALIPLLDSVLSAAAGAGAEQVVLGMSHRGRLNVMAHIAGQRAADIFAGFEDVDPRSVLGSGDVKYHVGATGEYRTRDGRKLSVHLASNPSHLEAVDPVVVGRARAKQTRAGSPGGAKKVLPILLHGDAAFAGQGVWAETLNFADLAAYTVGGTIHVIVNNLLGFTTEPADLHSSRFASSLAKRQAVPIFHVNGEDPDAVVRVGQIALEYRSKFASDVVVDVIGYRRHGHSEVDDPTITQPLLYAKIKDHPQLWQIYAKEIGADPSTTVTAVRGELESAHKAASEMQKKPRLRKLPSYWSPYKRGRYDSAYEVDTGVASSELAKITDSLTSYPPDFAIHPKVKKLLEQRAEMGHGKRPVDYGMGEALAFASLLLAGTPVRFTGQDTRRGTFNQRHAALVDTRNESQYVTLEHLAPNQARCEIYNSTLSEAGVLGFEYGYSRDYPEALVLWEAQFGDFANSAQIIIDQFISAAEDKWDLPSGVGLLLPHGYEGQGPEHSSARIERYLQLAAEDNIQVCQPSNAAQYFQLLRRQALRRWRKPMIVFTPKSMLRHPDASSPIEDFARPRFEWVVPDREVGAAERVLICTGKIGHELRAERKARGDSNTAILFLDQLYPFPKNELRAEMARHPNAREMVWVQEEPANMGALSYVLPRIRTYFPDIPARSVKRSASASPATGSAKAHELEQKTLLTLAFTTGPS